MSDSKFDPLKELANLRQNITRAVQQGIRTVLPETFPALDMYETDDELVIQTQPLLGLLADSLNVSVDDDKLTLKGETVPATDIPETAYLQRERTFGTFERVVRLPCHVQALQAKSNLKAGVLTIRLPKLKEDNQIISITPIQE